MASITLSNGANGLKPRRYNSHTHTHTLTRTHSHTLTHIHTHTHTLTRTTNTTPMHARPAWLCFTWSGARMILKKLTHAHANILIYLRYYACQYLFPMRPYITNVFFFRSALSSSFFCTCRISVRWLLMLRTHNSVAQSCHQRCPQLTITQDWLSIRCACVRLWVSVCECVRVRVCVLVRACMHTMCMSMFVHMRTRVCVRYLKIAQSIPGF